MERDKAIRKVVLRMSEPFPAGLEDRLMSRIAISHEKKQKKEHVFGIVMASLVSMLLIGGAIVIMKAYFPLSPEFGKMSLKFSEQTSGLLVFSCFIAGIVLLLLFLDTYIRQIKHHSESQ
jgi:hypothetical protein